MHRSCILLLIATLGCDAKPSEPSPSALASPVVTAEARCAGLLDSPQAECVLTFSGVVITLSGTGHVVATAGGAVFQSELPFEDAYLDGVVNYTSYQNSPILLFSVSDGDSGWGAVVRLQPPEFRTAWHLKVPAFNVGAGTLEGSSLYVSGIGFVARIDVESGQYLWKHEGLYGQRDQSFNSFDAPVVMSTEVLFRESYSQNISRPLKVIRAQKESGVFSVGTWPPE
jgi:hypothetical protein